MAQVTITFSFPDAIFQDLVTGWLSNRSQIGTLAANVASTDTSATIGQNFTLQPGQTIVIDNEAIPVADVSGQTINFGTRGQLPGIPAATHAAGVLVYALTYPDWFTMFHKQAVAPWSTGIVQQVANMGKSAVLPAPTGTVTVTL